MLKIFVFLGLTLWAQPQAPKAFQEEKELIILHTNDLHSSLQGSAPENDYTPYSINDDHTQGGFSRIATVIKSEKATNANVLALDGGDFLMGTLFQSLEMETGFQLKLMHDMGYDAVCVGNHEFDFGVGQLCDYINTAQPDSCPALLLANLAAKGKTQDELAFAKLLNDNAVKPYHIIETKDFRVGVIGLLGDEAYDVANAHQLKLKNKVKTARKWVKHLRKSENVDLIIALSHSGVWLENDSTPRPVEDVELAKKVEGIDLIISGHTHSLLPEPLWVNNTCIVQAGDHGRKMGRLTLRMGANVEVKNYGLINIDDKILGDKIIQEKIDNQKQLLNQKILSQLPYHYDSALFYLDFPLHYRLNVEQTNIGNFIADAMHYYVNQHVKDYAHIAIISHGMIRTSLPEGEVYLPEVFNAVSLGSGNDGSPGYPLSQIYLTAKELKRLMNLLIKAAHRSSNYYLFSSGFQIDYTRKESNFDKIETMRIKNASGTYDIIDNVNKKEKLYAIVADTYTISFLAKIKKKTLGIINVEPKDKNGEVIKNIEESIIDINPEKEGLQEAKTWVSIIEYAQSFKIKEDQLPHIPYRYEEHDLRLQCVN